MAHYDIRSAGVPESDTKAQYNIIVFLGSCRPGRMGDRVSNRVLMLLKSKGVNPILFDPMQMPFEILRQPLHFMTFPGKAPQWMQKANRDIQNADGFVIVSPEYNSTLPPGLVNMLDHFGPPSYKHRPCAIVTYSISVWSGVRCATAMRPFLSSLGIVTIPAFVAIHQVDKSFNEGGVCHIPEVNRDLDHMINELIWYVKAIKVAKQVKPPPV